MEIIVVVLALAFLQVWGSRNPLHRDGWFALWRKLIGRAKIPFAEFKSFLLIALPLALVAVLFEVIARQSSWLALPVAVIILLYSFGRGEFFEIVREYTQACYVEDWESASKRAARFDLEPDELQQDDWPGLHRMVFDEAGYRGFERMFAVLFWFLLLGPVGALMYRLVFLQAKYQAHHDASADMGTESDSLAMRWLWIIEWPAVRVLGISFALTGNFSGCFERLRECFLCVNRSTVAVLSPMILGALTVGDDVEPDCEITRKELTLLSKLYQRTLWLWLALASFIVIFS